MTNKEMQLLLLATKLCKYEKYSHKAEHYDNRYYFFSNNNNNVLHKALAIIFLLLVNYYDKKAEKHSSTKNKEIGEIYEKLQLQL